MQQSIERFLAITVFVIVASIKILRVNLSQSESKSP